MFSRFPSWVKGSSSRPAENGDVPAQDRQATGPPQNSNHFQGEKFISMLSSLRSLANLAVCSDALFQSWKEICVTKDRFNNELSGDPSVWFTEKALTKYNIIVFVTAPLTKSLLFEKTELVSSSESTISYFDFLRSSRPKSSFSINKAALSLFGSRKKELSDLIDKIAKEAESKDSKPYIITGDGIGGSVASLFALQLLFKLVAQKAKTPPDAQKAKTPPEAQKTKMPLCITFGSPLLGDIGFQTAISDHTTWNSCFLHVVSVDDCFRSLFGPPNHPADGQTTDHTSTYHPFGRFMFCSNSGGACFEHPESALELLRKIGVKSGGDVGSFNYESIIANLRKELVCKNRINLNSHGTGSSGGRASVAARYLADLFQLQDVSQLEELLEDEMSVVDQKRYVLEKTAKDLNDAKINMVHIEWYKKISERNKTPYYDSYKNQLCEPDIHVGSYKVQLQIYWELLVKEAAEKPQKAGAELRDRWLLGGTTYRKLVEPLAIADYYRRKGARNYITEGRSGEKLKHYELLELWFKEGPANKNTEKQDAYFPSLTEDSCFWAHVEEAIISCQNVTQGESTSSELEKLKELEGYFWEQIEKKEVSSDIFLERSSFMKWWEDYKRLMGTSYTSPLSEIIHERKYILYKQQQEVISLKHNVISQSKFDCYTIGA